MAENSSSNNSYLFLEDGITIPNLPLLVLLVYNGVGVLLPLLIVGSLFCCRKLINYHVKRCPHCNNPRSIRARCKNSTIGRMTKFCNVIEQFTAWLLVDLFHTPKVERVSIRGKLRLTVAKRQVQNNNTFSITAAFFYISTLFCLYIAKVILDTFVKITPTCINEGDFGFPTFCYADLSGSDHQINCTTWNEHSDLLEEATGSLLCMSLFYNFLTTNHCTDNAINSRKIFREEKTLWHPYPPNLECSIHLASTRTAVFDDSNRGRQPQTVSQDTAPTVPNYVHTRPVSCTSGLSLLVYEQSYRPR